MQKELIRILKNGYNPYDTEEAKAEMMSIKYVFAFGLNLEKSIMNDTSFTRFKK